MENSKNGKDGKRPSATFVIGAVALLFLIVGYQAALFIHKAAVVRIIANHDTPDTVFIYQGNTEGNGSRAGEYADGYQDKFPTKGSNRVSGSDSMKSYARQTESARKTSRHSPAAVQIRRQHQDRKYECFRFDPNTAGIDDLMRLGFSLKQAQAIDNYRSKGGRFRRKSDFAKSYVVEDSVFRRLENYIYIPKIKLNSADSATFLNLPGIGKFFAGKMVSYRNDLGGYSYPEQLMDIWHFDQDKFDGLKDLVEVDTAGVGAYPLWRLPENDLASHPYIGKRAAHAIAIFRDNSPESDWTVANLEKAGILSHDKAAKLARCRIAEP
jgi:competence protein ComEA